MGSSLSSILVKRVIEKSSNLRLKKRSIIKSTFLTLRYMWTIQEKSILIGGRIIYS